MDEQRIRKQVRDGYARIEKERQQGGGCCGEPTEFEPLDVNAFAEKIGYTKEELARLPEGANLGLSCGNPTALAELKAREVVLDLGCGGGFDVLIAAHRVGQFGRAIGVDMTPEMVERAKRNALKAGVTNTEFHVGEIEKIPLEDASVDVVISNCVINLSPAKPRVFREIVRVLKPGGRVAVSDMVLRKPLPDSVREDLEAYVGCIAGAVLVDEYAAMMRESGLEEVQVETTTNVDPMEDVQDPLYRRIRDKLDGPPGEYIASAKVRGVKPK
ncbi:MAG: arsenite methyltransferase [Candidatus Eisenbacteria bacterium]|nr:arsenite methyltransferase [Candidatus Latescibacterota bacterium]MBD3301153.1 arsenite methyltransferase [Candidatus Eisenbacteria bacterium]